MGGYLEIDEQVRFLEKDYLPKKEYLVLYSSV